MDIVRTRLSDGLRNLTGTYIGAGAADAHVASIYGGSAGTVSFSGYTAGIYSTLLGQSNWYIDAVVQGTYFDSADAGSNAGEHINTDGWALTASLEAGYPIKLGAGWAIEPSGQIIYQHSSLGSASDDFGNMSFPDADLFRGRLGLRLVEKVNSAFSFWARANF